MKKVEQVCKGAGGSGTQYRRRLKKIKIRIERHAANRDPEVIPAYGKFRGYEF